MLGGSAPLYPIRVFSIANLGSLPRAFPPSTLYNTVLFGLPVRSGRHSRTPETDPMPMQSWPGQQQQNTWHGQNFGLQ